MRTITKRPEPASLMAHRKTPHSDYENYSDKDALRYALITEQGGICCYCMGRIRNGPTTMKIEHWKSRSRYPNEQLNYRNLLGACLGGHGQPVRHQHCDTRKGNNEIKLNPANSDHSIETRIRYELDGSIGSNEPDFNDHLNDVLNLNLVVLKNNRKRILDAILDWWKHEKTRFHGPVLRTSIERQRDHRTNKKGELEPYCQVAVWWLEQRLAKMAS